MENFIDMIDDYVIHLTHVTQGKSLLARIYGLYTIHSGSMEPIDVIIMQNTANMIDKSN